MVPLIVDGQKDGNELVSAFTDLASNTFETYVVAKLEQSFLPCQRVEIHRVQKRAVQIEDSGFRQLTALHVRIATAAQNKMDQDAIASLAGFAAYIVACSPTAAALRSFQG